MKLNFDEYNYKVIFFETYESSDVSKLQLTKFFMCHYQHSGTTLKGANNVSNPIC